MKPIFIDTNIFIYAAGNPHPYKNPCIKLLEKIAQNKLKAVIDAEILQEILYRYSMIKELSRGLMVFDDCIKIVPAVISITKQDLVKTKEIIQNYPNINARDAIHAAVMLNHNILTIYSYDKHFDQIKEIKRIEP